MSTTHLLFFAVVGVSVTSLLLLCTKRRALWIRHSYILPLFVYFLYEASLPEGMNIRVDLLVLWPVLLFVIIFALMRMRA